jgi:hypothetical protein
MPAASAPARTGAGRARDGIDPMPRLTGTGAPPARRARPAEFVPAPRRGLNNHPRNGLCTDPQGPAHGVAGQRQVGDRLDGPGF